MPREKMPLKRESNSNKEIIINIHDIWRNEDIQNYVIKNIKKLKK